MANLWTKIDIRVIQNPPVYLAAEDECYYAREFVSRGGYSAGVGNQCVANFKKTPDRKAKPEWYWRNRAVQQFANELGEFIPANSVVAAIPTSKCKGDADYCDRFDELLNKLRVRRQDLRIVDPIVRTKSMDAFHQDKRTRRVEDVLADLSWTGVQGSPPLKLWLIDDVITAGTNFKACQRLIRQHAMGMRVAGVFWARTVWPEGVEPDMDE